MRERAGPRGCPRPAPPAPRSTRLGRSGASVLRSARLPLASLRIPALKHGREKSETCPDLLLGPICVSCPRRARGRGASVAPRPRDPEAGHRAPLARHRAGAGQGAQGRPVAHGDAGQDRPRWHGLGTGFCQVGPSLCGRTLSGIVACSLSLPGHAVRASTVRGTVRWWVVVPVPPPNDPCPAGGVVWGCLSGGVSVVSRWVLRLGEGGGRRAERGRRGLDGSASPWAARRPSGGVFPGGFSLGKFSRISAPLAVLGSSRAFKSKNIAPSFWEIPFILESALFPLFLRAPGGQVGPLALPPASRLGLLPTFLSIYFSFIIYVQIGEDRRGSINPSPITPILTAPYYCSAQLPPALSCSWPLSTREGRERPKMPPVRTPQASGTPPITTHPRPWCPGPSLSLQRCVPSLLHPTEAV